MKRTLLSALILFSSAGGLRAQAPQHAHFEPSGKLSGLFPVLVLEINIMQPIRLLAAIFVLGFAPVGLAAPVELLTPEEAAKPNLSVVKDPVTGKFAMAGDKAPVSGAPAIVFDMPSLGAAVATPFPVKIRFVPAGDARIALNTLKIEVLKIVPISLLSRVKPYLTDSGISVPEAKFPTGQFNLRIAISDTKGREGVAQGTWVIK